MSILKDPIKWAIDTNKGVNEYPSEELVFSTSDVNTIEFEIDILKDGVAFDLTNTDVRLCAKKPFMNYLYTDARIIKNGNKINIPLDSELLNVKGKYRAEIELVTGEEKLTCGRFYYKVNESNYDAIAQNNLEVFEQLKLDVADKVDETRVVEIVTEQVQGGVDLSGYSKVDHTHTNYADVNHTHNYMTYYYNPIEGTVFNDGDIIVEDVEVGGTI